MPRCVYKDENGMQCHSKGGSPKREGLCLGHAMKTGVIKGQEKENVRANMIKAHEKRRKNPEAPLQKKIKSLPYHNVI